MSERIDGWLAVVAASLLAIGSACGPGGNNNGGSDSGTTPDTGADTSTPSDTSTSTDTSSADADGGTDGGGGRPSCSSPTEINGALEEDRTLGPNDCYISSDLTLKDDATLTIKQGVLFQFEKGAKFKLENQSTLVTQGASNNRVWISGSRQQPGWWRGIFTTGQAATVELDQTVVEYGGASGAKPRPRGLLVKEGGTLEMSNTTLRKNDGWGLVAPTDKNVDIPTFDNNTITGNAEGAAFMNAELLPDLKGSSTFTGNADDHIQITGDRVGQVRNDTTIPDLGVPYRVGESKKLVTKKDATLTFAAGVTVEFEKDAFFKIEGSNDIVTEGTSGNEVRWTGSEKQRGWWRGLKHSGAAVGLDLDHTVIEYGGQMNNENAALNMSTGTNTLTLAIDNTTIRESSGHAIWLSHRGVTINSFANNEFTKNGGTPLSFDVTHVGAVETSNSLGGNDSDYFEIRKGQLESKTTFRNHDVPYLVTARVVVKDQGELIVKPGTEVAMGQGAWFKIGGTGETGATFVADASGGDPIVFRGKPESSGVWDGINYVSSESVKNALRNVVISGAGNSKTGNLRVTACCGNTVETALQDITFKRCGTGDALHVGVPPKETKLKNCGGLSLGTGCTTEVAGHNKIPPTFSGLKSQVCQ